MGAGLSADGRNNSLALGPVSTGRGAPGCVAGRGSTELFAGAGIGLRATIGATGLGGTRPSAGLCAVTPCGCAGTACGASGRSATGGACVGVGVLSGHVGRGKGEACNAGGSTRLAGGGATDDSPAISSSDGFGATG